MEEIAVNHKRVGSGQEAQVLALQTENERLKAEVAASELREATWAQKFDAARDGFAKRLYNVRKRHILKRRKLQSKYRAEVAALRTEMAVKDRDYINLCIHGQQEEKAMRDLSRQLQDACMENDSLKAEVAALRERWDTAMKEAESAAGHEFGLWPMGAAVAIAALREDKARFVRIADALLAAAEEALELREALEWLAGPEVISLRLYHPTKLDPKFEAYVSMQLAGGIIGVGATPLEAIQNARRRK